MPVSGTSGLPCSYWRNSMNCCSPHVPPLSPPFHVNLVRGLRFVQASVLVRATQFLGPARALPVRFEPAPPAVKPPSLKAAHKHTRKNQRNQTKQKRDAKKKTSAQTAHKQAALVTPEEKEYRLQKKLCALRSDWVYPPEMANLQSRENLGNTCRAPGAHARAKSQE